MIAVIDYGAGNLHSVTNALDFIGCEHTITNNKNEILNADGAILPGVGAFGDALVNMSAFNTEEIIKEFLETGKPMLGICLGLQLLFEESEESPEKKGLSILKGRVKKFEKTFDGMKIPHIGWNSLNIKSDNGIFSGIEQGSYFYFVHSYYVCSDDKNAVSATCNYGIEFDCAVQKNNLIATQFHPEKSGAVGLKVLNNFVKMTR